MALELYNREENQFYFKSRQKIMGHIFISYSRKDVVYAEKLINALKREGFNPWLDADELGAGTQWEKRLKKQIETCDAYLVIMTPKAYKSEWVPNELVAAKSKGKPIFPLLLEDTELFLALQTTQYEDVRGGKLPTGEFYDRLAKVTTRRKKKKIDEVSLTQKAREKKVEAAAEKASYVLSKISSGMKDAFAVASKVTATTYKSVAESGVMKNISSKVKERTNRTDKTTKTRKKKKK